MTPTPTTQPSPPTNAEQALIERRGCPECKKLRSELTQALEALLAVNARIHSGYDWNADEDAMTLMVGRVLLPTTGKSALIK